MAAPKKNRFWELRSKHGRAALFASPDLMWQAACEYFVWCEDNPLLEVEQARGTAKPVKNEKTGKWTFPPNIIKLPKLRAFTIHGLCSYLGCNTKYFNDFKDGLKGKPEEEAEGFSEVILRIHETIYNQKFTGAAAGFLNPNIIARDLGLRDKIDSELTGKDGAPIQTQASVIILPSNGREINAS